MVLNRHIRPRLRARIAHAYSKMCYTLYLNPGRYTWAMSSSPGLGVSVARCVRMREVYKTDRVLNASATPNGQTTTQAPSGLTHRVRHLRSNQAQEPFVSSSSHPCLFLTLTNAIDYRTELNNFLQVNGGSRRLQWKKYEQGPQHELIWTAICESECFHMQRRCT